MCRRRADDARTSRSNLNPVHCDLEIYLARTTRGRRADDMLLYQPTWYLCENKSNFLKYLIFLASLFILIVSKMAGACLIHLTSVVTS